MQLSLNSNAPSYRAPVKLYSSGLSTKPNTRQASTANLTPQFGKNLLSSLWLKTLLLLPLAGCVSPQQESASSDQGCTGWDEITAISQNLATTVGVLLENGIPSKVEIKANGNGEWESADFSILNPMDTSQVMSKTTEFLPYGTPCDSLVKALNPMTGEYEIRNIVDPDGGPLNEDGTPIIPGQKRI
jgi:hypothetical protein